LKGDVVDRLLVIGGGPKAAAIAAKSKVLRELVGQTEAPEIYVLDNVELCANWTGKYGFTSGSQRLGTPPEKDIGFPYHKDKKCPELTDRLFAEYSWLSFQALKKGTFGDWVDRGRPHPTHKEWADYITYVIKETADKTIIPGSVEKITQNGKVWNVLTRLRGRDVEYEFSGIVVTGPGECKIPQDIEIPATSRIIQGEQFWRAHRDIVGRIHSHEDALPVVVIGGGETVAAIVSYLVDEFEGSDLKIVVLTRSGTIFSRGEGYHENRVFTQYENWVALPSAVRWDVIKRADRGVFSIEVARKLASARNVDHRFMKVNSVKSGRTSVTLNGNFDCQLAIFALGFDPYWFARLLDPKLQKIFAGEKNQLTVQTNIGHDLSVDHRNLTAKLYLPMIAGFAQGPGFPNLSCLGLLSDRILGRV
jgi:mycobactin lysine-N-oxygenase